MLDHNASFSIYMVHGGTSFGFSAGANSPPFSPQTTSYDYDAPITEAGWASSKYFALRELFLKHLAPGESLPEVPPRQPVIEIQPMELTECAPLFANLPPARHSERPLSLEMMDQAHGAVLYQTKLPAGRGETLALQEMHDYGLIFINGQKIATLDRRKDHSLVVLPHREKENALSLLIDTFGHVNYGRGILDRKGITEKVELRAPGRTNELTGWEIYNLPLNANELARLKFKPGATDAPAFYRARFELKQPGDTFLDFRTWGKGVAWVNGHNLGRFWDIGPQQTLYCPGPWLKTGRNEVIVFESNGARKHTLSGLADPILDQVKEASGL
jgi:beta-galactosidase